MKLKGVYVANVSPFTPKGELDLSALRQLYTRLAEEGVAGFVPCGTTGEGPTLTSAERRQVIGLAVEIAKSRNLQVIAGCNSNATEIVLEQMTEAKALGAQAALVVTPYYNKPTQAGLLAHYRRLADAAILPIVLYNVPGRTAVNLSVETVQALFEHPQIIGLKEATGQYAQWLSLSCKLNLKEKALLAGDDDALAAILALGGSGIISASANVTAIPFVQMCQAASAGRWEEVFSLQKRVLPLVQAVFAETNPSPAKYALCLKGEMEDTVRLPLVTVTEATKQVVAQALKTLELAQ